MDKRKDFYCYGNDSNDMYVVWMIAVIIQLFMFLNLKSKRVQNALQNHLKTNNHPKTQREQRPQRLSKQHGEVRTKKTGGNMLIKKQTASTALTTMQAGSSCSNVAHHYIIHRIQSIEKDTPESFNKSVQKIDSQRSQKIANAYRKIKKYDGSERIQTEESIEEKSRKSQNRSYYPINKKEVVSNFANNYIAITEADEFDKRNEGKDAVQYCFKMIELFLQMFRSKDKMKSSSVVKFRSLSSKEIDLNDSLEKSKRSNKNLKSRGKGTVTNRNQEQNDSLQDFVDRFRDNLTKCQQNFQIFNEKYQANNLSNLMKELYGQLQNFTKQLQNKCLSELQQKCIQYQKGLQIVIMQQNELQKHCSKLQYALSIQRNRNTILAQSLEQLHNRSLYGCAFLNQASFHFDLDTFIREKIYQFSGGDNDSAIPSKGQSISSLALKKEFLQSDFAFTKEKKKG